MMMYKLAQTLEFTTALGADDLHFRIDVLSASGTGHYVARLYRWEYYKMAPSFGARGLDHADAQVLAIDDFWDWTRSFDSSRGALEAVLEALREQLPSAGIPRAAELLA